MYNKCMSNPERHPSIPRNSIDNLSTRELSQALKDSSDFVEITDEDVQTFESIKESISDLSVLEDYLSSPETSNGLFLLIMLDRDAYTTQVIEDTPELNEYERHYYNPYYARVTEITAKYGRKRNMLELVGHEWGSQWDIDRTSDMRMISAKRAKAKEAYEQEWGSLARWVDKQEWKTVASVEIWWREWSAAFKKWSWELTDQQIEELESILAKTPRNSKIKVKIWVSLDKYANPQKTLSEMLQYSYECEYLMPPDTVDKFLTAFYDDNEPDKWEAQAGSNYFLAVRRLHTIFMETSMSRITDNPTVIVEIANTQTVTKY